MPGPHPSEFRRRAVEFARDSNGELLRNLADELLNRRRWTSRRQLAQAILEWIEVFCNAHRWHSTLGMLARLPTPRRPNRCLSHGLDHHTRVSGEAGELQASPTPTTHRVARPVGSCSTTSAPPGGPGDTSSHAAARRGCP